MDLNHRLIEAVRQCPLLYKTSASLSDRKCGWKQIAQEMKMQEALLKTRWHFLREHYKRNVLSGNQIDTSQFPYKKEMEFLLPYLRAPPREVPQNGEAMPISIIKPEFIITAEDLENDSGNEEYVFLEVEALGPEYEVNNEEIQQTSHNDLRKELEEEQEEQNQNHTIKSMEDEVEMKKEKSGKYQQDNCEQLNDLKPDLQEIQRATCNKNGTAEEEAVRNLIQEASEEKIRTKVEVREGDSSSDHVGEDVEDNVNKLSCNSIKQERCEDAIFGELVAAMLKKMPTDKKRSVKRDIMNLLLT